MLSEKSRLNPHKSQTPTRKQRQQTKRIDLSQYLRKENNNLNKPLDQNQSKSPNRKILFLRNHSKNRINEHDTQSIEKNTYSLSPFPQHQPNNQQYNTIPSHYNADVSDFAQKPKIKLKMINNNNIEKQKPLQQTMEDESLMIRKFCQSHVDRKAKYLCQVDGQFSYCCSKCAVVLVTQGYKVSPIDDKGQLKQSKQSDRNRVNKLNHLLKAVEAKELVLQQSLSDLQSYKHSLQFLFSQEQKKINQYYSKVINILVQFKKQSNRQIKCLMKKTFEQIANIQFDVSSNLQHISFIKTDIVPNMSSIVDRSKVTQENFSSILQVHGEKLQNLEDLLKSWKSSVVGFGHFETQKISDITIQNIVLQLRPQLKKRKLRILQIEEVSEPSSREAENFSFDDINAPFDQIREHQPHSPTFKPF